MVEDTFPFVEDDAGDWWWDSSGPRFGGYFGSVGGVATYPWTLEEVCRAVHSPGDECPHAWDESGRVTDFVDRFRQESFNGDQPSER